jgi:hypothetical protein
LSILALVGAASELGAAVTVYAQSAAPSPAPDAPGSVYDGLVQIALTDAQVQQYVAAQTDMETAMGDASADAGAASDPKTIAKLDAVAKKYKFASYEEFNQVAGNLALALDGVDPKTKTYVGAEALLKQQVAAIKADTKLAAADKTETLAELNDELKNITPVKFHGNIDLVIKYYDSLAAPDPK